MHPSHSRSLDETMTFRRVEVTHRPKTYLQGLLFSKPVKNNSRKRRK